ncbi:TPA: YadA-like family protein [Neisseria lactamica]|uniref:YadA-like family protein n=1 Tax=Neisseria lactamica TaxID=486 RepID=UPI000E590247|nr:YadA-like family protein [Neisseria lactamica]
MGLGNIAIGVNAEAQGNDISYATSIGTSAKANKSAALALGGASEALGIYSIAEGYSANSDGYGAIAIGSAAKIKQLEKGKINHIAGQNNKGLDVDADGNVTKITIRTESKKDILSKYGQTYGAMALGFRSSSHNLFASSFGAFSTATAIESLAVGDSSQSTGYRSATFGSHSRALAEESLALGYETRANAYGSVALGAESVANEENTVSVGSDTLKRKITNVADGAYDSDAVNVRQLNRLSKRANRIGASAAALASLKPAQLGKDDKFALSLGFGSYKNAQAVAMGAVFKPAENVLLNVAGSFAGPDRAFGAGVSWKFGGKPTSAVASQNAAHSAEVLQLQQEVAALRARQAETDRKLHKQAEMENELQQLRRALSELKKTLKQ